jgi:lysozyme family protein
MSFAFNTLKPEYEQLLSISTINEARHAGCVRDAQRILDLKGQYLEVNAQTGIPAVWMMAVGEREAGNLIMQRYFGNGQSLKRATTEVPRGQGPFDSWVAGTLSALRLLKIDRVKDWTWPLMLYEGEAWNGFGPRIHGLHTGYLWAGTNIYSRGKYVSDGVWNPDAIDSQLGTVALMKTLVALDPTLDIKAPSPAVVVPPPMPAPPSIDYGVAWVQDALNHAWDAGLLVDGNLGRRTVYAIAEFQAAHGLVDDGNPGPLTVAAIKEALGDID